MIELPLSILIVDDEIELATRMRAINNKIKIFLMTAFDIADIENQNQYKSAKMDGLIQKPIKLSILEDIFNHCLLRPTLK